ncbi:hypothetical protein [Mesorhizobium sp. M7A.F.Ce.TU.012.03.2.1]|uniref:Mu transposase domain-containing protein n=1 Tax=Mesorhizobium sp. M7A.F.Ce.TU.012.03.2.1 TaxID=2493681 RepID=UPI001FE16A93|nr:hypothetical protein [Mesorhizobium sp. M7A.F.Ce.TU.012.03.2.1]
MAQSCILGRLWNQTFFSLDEANAAIREAVERINTHVMRRLDQCRRDLFETMERPALAALPAEEYEFAEWRLARVNRLSCRVRRYFYSVPHNLIREQVDLRATSRTIEVLFKGKRVAVHQRRYGGVRFGTDPDHMPSSHRRYAEWSPERFRRWAHSIGPQTEAIVIAILASRPHPEQGFRTCLGVIELYQAINTEQAEAVSARALEIGGLNCKSISALIKFHKASRHTAEPAAVGEHCNVRRPGYFH